MDGKPLVSINCLVYNHEPYLRECLDGFVMQKTTFPFEAIVHDDASTDRSAEIIREYAEKYPDIIKPIYEKANQYSKYDGSLNRIMDKACTAKYIAFCEGDDFWIDSTKLEKQVNFLENNPEYGMVHTNCDFIQRDGLRKKIRVQEILYSNYEKNKSSYAQAILDNKELLVRTATVLVRRSLLERAKKMDPSVFGGYYLMGDIQNWFGIAIQSKIKYFPYSTSVYRFSYHSATRGQSVKNKYRFLLSSQELRMYYIQKYEFPDDFVKSVYENYAKYLFLYKLFDSNFKEKFKSKIVLNYKKKILFLYSPIKYILGRIIRFILKNIYSILRG